MTKDKIEGAVGFVLFLVGAGAMDSDKLFIPAAMCLVGIALLEFVVIREMKGE